MDTTGSWLKGNDELEENVRPSREGKEEKGGGSPEEGLVAKLKLLVKEVEGKEKEGELLMLKEEGEMLRGVE